MNFELMDRLASARVQLHRKNVLMHPFAHSAVILRKVVERTADSVMGGLPTLGGLGVLDSEDEEAYSFEHVGNATVIHQSHFAGQYQPSSAMDLGDTTIGAIDTIPLLIEPESDDSSQGAPKFELKKHDLVYLIMGADYSTAPKLAFEIVGINPLYNAVPAITIYECNRRAELDEIQENRTKIEL